jgi:Sec-independent protein translocase protein TatA
MDILGIGLPEIFFIVILALILLGPKDMVKAGRTIGRTLRAFVMSPTWQAMRTTGKEIQQIPTKLMREAGLEELQAEVQGIKGDVETATKQNLDKIQSVENQILAGPLPPAPASPPKKQESTLNPPPTSEK